VIQPSVDLPVQSRANPEKPARAIGLRPPYYAAARRGEIAVDWLELITENFMVPGGQPLAVLEDVCSHYPVAFHGVSMNLGGTDPLDQAYLQELKELVSQFQPLIVSDHLCWTRHGGHHLHDLLPLPYVDEVVDHVARRIDTVQELLGRQILIENLSSYVEFNCSEMPEWEFLSSIAERADCLLLLDINNIVVSAHNHHFEPLQYLKNVPAGRVAQHHVAGHSEEGVLKIDTHDNPVPDLVKSLYDEARQRFGPVPVCLERDDNIPQLDDLLQELGWITAAAVERSP
jgi:uncharacterized protein